MSFIDALQKANEGGYNYAASNAPHVYLDPAFWQSLGKALGWKDDGSDTPLTSEERELWEYLPRWHVTWHHFIDHLADDETAESFFAEFLKEA